MSTISTGPFSGSQIKTKQEAIMAIGNNGQNPRRQSRDQTKRKPIKTEITHGPRGIRNSAQDAEDHSRRDT